MLASYLGRSYHYPAIQSNSLETFSYCSNWGKEQSNLLLSTCTTVLALRQGSMFQQCCDNQHDFDWKCEKHYNQTGQWMMNIANQHSEEHFRWLELKSACCPGHILSLPANTHLCMLCMRPVNKLGKYNFCSQFDFIDFGFRFYPCRCHPPHSHFTLTTPINAYMQHKSVAGKFPHSFVNLSIKFDINE